MDRGDEALAGTGFRAEADMGLTVISGEPRREARERLDGEIDLPVRPASAGLGIIGVVTSALLVLAGDWIGVCSPPQL